MSSFKKLMSSFNIFGKTKSMRKSNKKTKKNKIHKKTKAMRKSNKKMKGG